MNHMREAALTDEDGFPFDFDQQLPIMDPLSPETQCQFILKRNRKIPNRIAIGKLVCFRMKEVLIEVACLEPTTSEGK